MKLGTELWALTGENGHSGCHAVIGVFATKAGAFSSIKPFLKTMSTYNDNVEYHEDIYRHHEDHASIYIRMVNLQDNFVFHVDKMRVNMIRQDNYLDW